jgi:hypothetical protein
LLLRLLPPSNSWFGARLIKTGCVLQGAIGFFCWWSPTFLPSIVIEGRFGTTLAPESRPDGLAMRVQ